MSSSGSSPATLDPELKAKWDALLYPKIKPSEDGTCVVSVAAMQHIFDELGTLTAKLDKLRETSKKMLYQQSYNVDKKPDILDVAKMATKLPVVSQKLKDLHLTLHMALPMKGYEEYDHLKVRIPPFRVEFCESSFWDMPKPGKLDPAWRPCCAMTDEELAKMNASASAVALAALAPAPTTALAPAPTTAPAEPYVEEDLYA
jgi:hypothetical protein